MFEAVAIKADRDLCMSICESLKIDSMKNKEWGHSVTSHLTFKEIAKSAEGLYQFAFPLETVESLRIPANN